MLFQFDKMAVLARLFVVTLLSLLLASCSGSSGSGTQVAEGGISGTGIDSGSVSRFSSVVVNGVVIEIDGQTQIFVDEQSATEADLKVGYVLRVDTDFDTNTARRIDYTETVRGPNDGVVTFNPDTLDGSFVLLGQDVITNSVTTFDLGGVDLSSPTLAGAVLDVSGLRDANGAIVARYVGLAASTSEYRVVGTVTNDNGMTFNIGNLTVDYSAADTSQIAGGIVNGIAVRVKGPAGGFTAPNSFNAARVTPDSTSVSVDSGIPIRLEGAITFFNTQTDFDVRGIPVDASSPGVIFENGTAADLQLNLLVQVEGMVDAVGTIVASRIRIVPLANIRIESTTDSVDAANNSLVIQGVTFLVDENTEFKDDSSAQITQFSLANLNPFGGDWVEIRAYESGGNYIITKLERDDLDPNADLRIQSPVDPGGVDPTAFTVTLLGITVITDANTQYEDELGQPIPDPAVFFATVQPGDLVKAKWQNSLDRTLPVDELSLED